MLMMGAKLMSYLPALEHGMAAAASLTGFNGTRAGSSVWHDALAVARPVLSPLLPYAAHANFLLPFRWVPVHRSKHSVVNS
jgi:hypothetical protein